MKYLKTIKQTWHVKTNVCLTFINVSLLKSPTGLFIRHTTLIFNDQDEYC